MAYLRIFSALLAVIFSAVVAAQTPAASAPTPATASVPPPSAVSDPDYIIGPGDVLQVFVWRNPELSSSIPVRPDGKISTPLVEDMTAVGKTPSQLARDVEHVLAEFIRSPQVNVIVTLAMSTNSQIRVIGQVTKPQGIAYREGMTVLDAVLQVGGLSQFAAANRAKIVRTENGKQKEIKIKLDDLLNGGDMKQNQMLKPGDVLVVPQTRF